MLYATPTPVSVSGASAQPRFSPPSPAACPGFSAMPVVAKSAFASALTNASIASNELIWVNVTFRWLASWHAAVAHENTVYADGDAPSLVRGEVVADGHGLGGGANVIGTRTAPPRSPDVCMRTIEQSFSS